MAKRRYVYAHGKRVEVLDGTPPLRGRRKRAPNGETFAKIPHERALKLYGYVSAAALIILFELDRLIFKSFGQNPVRLSNHKLAAIGMVRSTKLKALRQLQGAGVITVVRDGHEAPLVTHHWYPTKP